eukprot:gene10833-22608_t
MCTTFDSGCYRFDVDRAHDSSSNYGCITSMKDLNNSLNDLFTRELSWPIRKRRILDILERWIPDAHEISKYTTWSSEKAYTRNLVATDPHFHYYSVLLLCWNPGQTSRIHNHPCNGCFIKTVSGSIREERYEIDPDSFKILPTSSKVFDQGQVSYMDDYLGYHKIDNPNHEKGAITLHIYTPPFSECKVWESSSTFSEHETAKVIYDSVAGYKTPQLHLNCDENLFIEGHVLRKKSQFKKFKSIEQRASVLRHIRNTNTVSAAAKSPSFYFLN